ncbi:MAG: hypothetical protein KAU01_00805, partial [Candidatus Cloacimonetes bacterium]|nr:hypothetical protein [Candidatus Cloacimonadota bacterium]
MKTKYFLIILILILFYSFSYSQDYWESIYSSGGSILCLSINSIGYLFTGTQNGIYRSIDNGNNWEYVGLENISVYCLTINSNNNIFAGTGGYYNIYRSIDNGANWTPQYSNPNASNIISLTINSYGDIFAGSGGDYSIIRSIDNGSSWELLLSLSDCEDVKSIVENSEGILFAGTTNWIGEGGGVYRSTDQGENWEHIGLEYEYISSLAINSNDEIFVGSRGQHYEYGGGVFRSSDNGETWTELRDDVLVTSIAIDSEEKIFIGCSSLDYEIGAVWVSEDNGENWQLIESDLIGIYTCIEFLLISEDDYVYAISYESISHIYRSVQPTVGIDDFSIQKITDIKLSNYPNPFKPSVAGRIPGTTISYELPVNVENPVIEIFNIKGEKIRQYSIFNFQSSIVWDGTDENNQP